MIRKLNEGAKEVIDKKEWVAKGIDPSTPKMSPTKRLIHLKNQKTPPRWEQKSNEKSFVDKIQSSEKHHFQKSP